MARTLTASATTEKNKQSGAKPLLLVKIEFGGAVGTKWYGDDDLSTPVAVSGRVVNAGEIDLRLSDNGLQAVSDITVQLADGDGTLLGYLDTVVWALKRATVYQHFIGNNESDLVPLLSGYIDGAPVWRDADGTVEFEVTDITTGYNTTIGRAATKDDFPYMPEESEGKILPVVYGRVEDLRPVQVTGGVKGTLNNYLKPGDEYFVLDNGEAFPQDEEITVRVSGEYIRGTVSGRKFTISERNAALYSGTTTPNTSNNVHNVYDYNAPDRDGLFNGMWLHIDGRYPSKIFQYYGGTGKYELGVLLWGLDGEAGNWIEAGVEYSVRGCNTVCFRYAGATVELAEASGVTYVVADHAGTEVHKIRAKIKRQVTLAPDKTEEREIEIDVPEEYYAVDYEDTTSFPGLGRAVTTIYFPVPLTQLTGEETWASDDILVELTGHGVANPAEVIKHLAENSGEIPAENIDDDSFAAAAASLTWRRFGFALTEERRLTELLGDLAFQAQSRLLVIGGVIHLFYLDDCPGSPLLAIGDDRSDSTVGNRLDTIERTWTPLSDLWSEITCQYGQRLGGEETEEKKFTLKDDAAEDEFGRRVGTEMNFWAYPKMSHAKATAQYYLNHQSRVWETPRMGCYLDAVELVPLDWVTIGTLKFWNDGQQAKITQVRNVSGDADGEVDRVELEMFMPIYPGCSGTCEVPCEIGGCEGAAEHDCADTCETGCVSSCETSCQDDCEIICVSSCEWGCTFACQQNCQAAGAEQGCGNACETVCEAGCEASCESGNEDACGSGCEVSCEWGCESSGCQVGCEDMGCESSCETAGCQMAGCESACMAACESSCETSCEGWCESDCETSGEVDCGASCETGACESASCEASSCETGCQTGEELPVASGWYGVEFTSTEKGPGRQNIEYLYMGTGLYNARKYDGSTWTSVSNRAFKILVNGSYPGTSAGDRTVWPSDSEATYKKAFQAFELDDYAKNLSVQVQCYWDDTSYLNGVELKLYKLSASTDTPDSGGATLLASYSAGDLSSSPGWINISI